MFNPVLHVASELSCIKKALVFTFSEGLAGHIRNELAGKDLSTSLDDLITLTTYLIYGLQRSNVNLNEPAEFHILLSPFRDPFLLPLSAP